MLWQESTDGLLQIVFQVQIVFLLVHNQVLSRMKTCSAMFGWAIKAEIIPWYQKRRGEQRKTEPLVHTPLWDNIQIICESILHHRAIYSLTHAEPMCLCFSTWREICSSIRDRRKIGACGWGKKSGLAQYLKLLPVCDQDTGRNLMHCEDISRASGLEE